MALARPFPPLLHTLFPAFNAPVRPVLNLPLLQRLSQSFPTILSPFAALVLPPLSLPSIPSISDIWEGILKAVPKKKTSYRKKRQRFLAGKGLRDITSLNTCSACGRVKRAHYLCPYCVYAVKTKIFGLSLVKTPKKKELRAMRREKIEERRNARRNQNGPKKRFDRDDDDI
ncbi:uncharacterized protein BDR25DRAFT_267691 [Lindgomyces ingoldianus]|uniref:Uncharacterized protein n=1 Tax=Lindgomyces ingoldianus TaxID=673940 RepID=A0ACB6QLE6_9PLEO|nr:uncharacterized protein BDR25DRAFT_267691 [Lindgomyces ingoldianus]KAF2466956.1 hypothetical protein BDR25DRAFT_267691 [Lindgomyces ingoldianus]